MQSGQRIRYSRDADLGIEVHEGSNVIESSPRQFHEEYEIGFVSEGAACFRYSHGAQTVAAGQFVVVNPGEPHWVRVPADPCSFVAIYVDAASFGEIGTRRSGSRGPPSFPASALCDAGFGAAFHRLRAGLACQGSRLEKETRLIEFCVSLACRHGGAIAGRRLPQERSRRVINRTLDYLHESVGDDVSLDTLASLSHVSKFHLIRVFRAALGMTPHAYQLQLRLLQAKELLTQGHIVHTVAVQTGFSDHSHFTRRFRRFTGVTPVAYRASVASARTPGDLRRPNRAGPAAPR